MTGRRRRQSAAMPRSWAKCPAMMTAPDFLCVIEPPGQADRLRPGLAAVVLPLELDARRDAARPGPAGQTGRPAGPARPDGTAAERPESERFVEATSLDQWLGLRAHRRHHAGARPLPRVRRLAEALQRRWKRRLLPPHARQEPGRARLRRLALGDGQRARSPSTTASPASTGFDSAKCRLPAVTPYGGLWTQSAA